MFSINAQTREAGLKLNKKPDKWTTRISLLTGTLLILLAIAASTAETRSLDIIEVEIQAEILPEGDLKITENRTIDFTGHYRGFEQTIDFAGIALYNQIIIREGNYYYTLVEDFPTFEPGTYSIKVLVPTFLPSTGALMPWMKKEHLPWNT